MNFKQDIPYLNLIKDIMQNGTQRGDRTGTGTISIFGTQMKFDLTKGFPLLTTKKIHWSSVVHELLWFFTGSTNIQYLKDENVRIWNEWANEKGEVGPMYGKQWTRWLTPEGEEINQLDWLLKNIKEKPNSRRLIVTAWNPADMPDESISPIENVNLNRPALTSCHNFFQVYVRNGYLDMMVNIRSNDMFLGSPFNIASYALLCHILAQQTYLTPGNLIVTIGDAHIYNNHIEQINIQLDREPKPSPNLNIKRKPNSIYEYMFDDFELVGYDPDPLIKGTISV